MPTNPIRYATAILTTCVLTMPLALMAISNDAKNNIVDNISTLAAKLLPTPNSLTNRIECAKKDPQQISDESLEALIKDLSELIPVASVYDNEQSARYNALAQSHETLKAQLKSYRISGFSWALDPNFALVVGNQNPVFTVTYCDPKGDIKTKKYQASIDLVGINTEAACRINLIFFTNTDANFYNTNKTIELGRGIEIGGSSALFFLIRLDRRIFVRWFETPEVFGRYTWLVKDFIQSLQLTYIPFNNAPGGLIILGSNFLGLSFGFISLVTGGTLTPIE